MKRISLVAVPLVLFFLVTGVQSLSTAPRPVREIVVDASGPSYSLEELTDRADVIALVRATGRRSEHWNNRANREWQAPRDSGVAPLIVRDELVLVIDIYRGEGQRGDGNPELALRTIGGTVGDTRMVFADLAALEPGSDYIVFLEQVEWPTQEGSESVLAPVAEGQGVFVSDGAGAYSNAAELVVTGAELAQ